MSWLRVLARGFAGRCPNCGERDIFRRWVHMHERCPQCGLYFERSEGYWTGGIAINTIVTSLLFVALMVGGMLLTWPDVPVAGLLIALVLFNGLFPVFFYPFSKTIWVAMDILLHPLENDERMQVETLRRLRDQAEPDQ